MVQTKERLSLIQLLRGMAALIVLFHHGVGWGRQYQSNFMVNIFSGGWVGVDLFFVLSGFIIFYIHYKDIGKKQSLRTFYLKRFIRIYPMYWIITLFLVTLFFIKLESGVGYERNIDVIFKSFILFPQSHQPIVAVGWSLVYEVFFYLVFGILIYLKPRYSFSLVLLWIFGILMNVFGFGNEIIKDNLFLSFIFSNNHIEFIFGCIVAYIIIKRGIKYNKSLLLIGIFGFIIGWIFVYNGSIHKSSTETKFLFGLSCSILILAATSIELKTKLKLPKFLLLIGDASYSIYLTHYDILLILFKILKTVNLSPIFIFLAVIFIYFITIYLGIIFHLLIEKPILNYLNKKFIKKLNEIQISVLDRTS